MARSQESTRALVEDEGQAGTVRIEEECLELDITAPKEIGRLRQYIGQVNGPAYPQPYLVEERPGRFRLYVGEAAERVRTKQGIRR